MSGDGVKWVFPWFTVRGAAQGPIMRWQKADNRVVVKDSKVLNSARHSGAKGLNLSLFFTSVKARELLSLSPCPL